MLSRESAENSQMEFTREVQAYNCDDSHLFLGTVTANTLITQPIGRTCSRTTLTAREFSTLSGIERDETEAYLNTLSDNGHLQKLETKNSSMWKYVQTEKELFIDRDQ